MKKHIPNKSQTIVPIINQFKTDLQKIYGQRFVKLILFGSYAKGKQHEESDVDLLLILNNMSSPSYEVAFTNELKTNYLLDYEIYFSIIPTTPDNFENTANPLYYNIKKEGIVI